MNRSQSSCSQVPAFPDFRAVRMCVHRSGMAIRSYRKRSMLRVCKCVTHTQTHTDKRRVGKRERQVRRISESLSDSCAQRPLTPTWRPPNHPLGTRMGPEGRSLDSKGEGRSLCLKWRPIKAIKTTRNSLLFFNNFLQRFFKDSFIHFAGEEGELEGGGEGEGGGGGGGGGCGILPPIHQMFRKASAESRTRKDSWWILCRREREGAEPVGKVGGTSLS